MPSALLIVIWFSFGVVMSAWILHGRQDRLTARFIDGRRVTITCRICPEGSDRWERGTFVIERGTWSWEPHPSNSRGRNLPADARIVRIRKTEGRERNRMHYRMLIVECVSGEGGVRLAVEPGHLEHVVMKLAPTGYEVSRPGADLE